MKNFRGLAELFASLWGEEYTPFVFNNWTFNSGVSKAWNEILETTKDFDLTIVCNDDIVWHGGSFKALLEGWKHRPEDCIMVTGSTGQGGDVYRGMPDYSAFAVNAAEYVKKIGWFDENFSPAYF